MVRAAVLKHSGHQRLSQKVISAASSHMDPGRTCQSPARNQCNIPAKVAAAAVAAAAVAAAVVAAAAAAAAAAVRHVDPN